MFYQIRAEPQGSFGIYRGGGARCTPVKGIEIFGTVEQAKRHALQTLYINPVYCHDDEILFNAADPVHAALQRIEDRQGAMPFEIMAVSSRHYCIRRSTYGAEQRIRYTVAGDHVIARKESEFFFGTEEK